VFVVIDAVRKTSESPVRLELHLQKAGELTILEPPEILAAVNLARHEVAPKSALDEALEILVRFDKTVRIKFRPEGDGFAILGTTKNSDRKLVVHILTVPCDSLKMGHTYLMFVFSKYLLTARSSRNPPPRAG
jgi:hypothetical protein